MRQGRGCVEVELRHHRNSDNLLLAYDASLIDLGATRVPPAITQSDSGELLRQLDTQFDGRWNLTLGSPSQCRECSDTQRHAAVWKERERSPPRNHGSVFQGEYRRPTGGLLHLAVRGQQP